LQDASTHERTISLNFTESDIVELVNGIAREKIIGLVKKHKYLSQQVFPGFRPNRLPWADVPVRLGKDAVGDPQKTVTLARLWLESNQDLVNKLASISPDDLRTEIMHLLVKRGTGDSGRILWALRLDSREDIQIALANGLSDELTDQSSPLMSQVTHIMLENEWRQAQQRLNQLIDEHDAILKLAATLELELQAANKQLGEWQAKYTATTDAREQLIQQFDYLQAQREADQETISQLNKQLKFEQAESRELRQSITSLKSTLRQQAEATEGRDDLLLVLEGERKTSASLRLDVVRLNQKLQEVYDKRDDALNDLAEAERQLKQVLHDKEVIIEQKRVLKEELDKLSQVLETSQVPQELSLVLPEELSLAWQTAQQEVHQQLRLLLTTPSNTRDGSVESNKLQQWQNWMEKEELLLQSILNSLTDYAESGQIPALDPVESTQAILATRWYLLEYIRRLITQLQDQQWLAF
jgi:hypothetical protein